MNTPEDLLTRAVETVVPRDLAEKKLQSGKPVRIYLGIDPTGNKLHIGHSVPLRKLKAFQDAGHDVIFLIGSFTATIGDPSGRDHLREPLTLAKVEENFQTYKKQAGKILDFSKVKIVYNHEWLGKLKFDEILKIASNFTVQQMLTRETFKQKLRKIICPACKKLFPDPSVNSPNASEEKCITTCTHCHSKVGFGLQDIFVEEGQRAIGLNEFLYPLMQGYDSVMLDVDCELGGNDQLFNMLCGRTLQAAFQKREKFVLTTKLIEGTDGRKMSKTYDNCVYLEDPPEEMFGKVMSVKDELMTIYFECCTGVPMEEVKKILKGNPRDAKARLAREIVALYHGGNAAGDAEKAFDRVFKDKSLPADITEMKAKKGTSLLDLLVSAKLAPSKSEGRRLIEQGGVRLNNKVVRKLDAVVEEGVINVGKRKFLKITIS
ncbi:MAG: tyrosine--tRNA ligase [Candidatus Peregrinibacteria bacterium]